MDKSRENKKKLDSRVVRAVAGKYDVTYYYVSRCVQRRRDGIMPDTLRKEYLLMKTKVEEAIAQANKQLKNK